MSIHTDLAVSDAELVVLHATLAEADRLLAQVDAGLARMQQIVNEMGTR